MEIQNIDSFLLFLIFFIPGFVSIKVYDLLVANPQRDFSKSVYEVIAFSTINFAVFFWLIDFITHSNFKESDPFLFYLSIALLFFVFPSLWPFLFVKLYEWKWFSRQVIHLSPTAWDFQFKKRTTHWVIVHLKDKRKVGGLFGLNSYASTYPNKEEIYLEEVWNLDDRGNFVDRVKQSEGILILSSEILAIEFFN